MRIQSLRNMNVLALMVFVLLICAMSQSHLVAQTPATKPQQAVSPKQDVDPFGPPPANKSASAPIRYRTAAWCRSRSKVSLENVINRAPQNGYELVSFTAVPDLTTGPKGTGCFFFILKRI